MRLVADAEVGDERVGIDVEAVAIGRHADAPAGPAGVEQHRGPGSLPSTMFSQTVKLSASMKCWNTMPMPEPMASAGERKWRSTPSTTTVPSSGRWAP